MSWSSTQINPVSPSQSFFLYYVFRRSWDQTKRWGVISDSLDWIILRSAWTSWKWPRAAHWSQRNWRLGSSCQFLEGISAASQPLTQWMPQKSQVGFTSWDWNYREGALLYLEVQLRQTAEKGPALWAPAFPAQRLLMKAFPGSL